MGTQDKEQKAQELKSQLQNATVVGEDGTEFQVKDVRDDQGSLKITVSER